MGLNKSTNNGKFLGITNGRISLRVPEGTDGAVERKITQGKNEGKSVHEIFFDSVSGYIVGGKLERKEFGQSVIESIVVKVKDGKEVFNLNIPWNSRMRDAFCKVVPNIDVEKPVEIVVFPSKKSGEEGVAVLLVKQEGEKLDWHYTRDHPNGLPQPEKKKVKGVDKWDFTEVEDFLWSKTEEFFEQFGGDEKPAHQEAASDEYEEDEEPTEVEEDDESQVPF